MSDKLPQPTHTLIHRLRRVARSFDAEAARYPATGVITLEQLHARANTCWQCAARLEELDTHLDMASAIRDIDGL